jgi:hypothetical protein
VVASDESKTVFLKSSEAAEQRLQQHPGCAVQLFTWVLDCVVNYAVPSSAGTCT